MSPDDLYLPAGYVENRPEGIDEEAEPTAIWSDADETRRRRARRWQDGVYRFAARLPLPPSALVMDVGCGTGDPLARHFGARPVRTLGIDQARPIELARRAFPAMDWLAADLREESVWEALDARRPDLVICADVIEHVDDPRLLLGRLRRLIGSGGRLVLSTPDRSRLEDRPALGPPRNPHHVREWTAAELRALVESVGFTVASLRHALPRRFDPTVADLKIVVWRALHLRAVPDRRSCMVFELVAAD